MMGLWLWSRIALAEPVIGRRERRPVGTIPE